MKFYLIEPEVAGGLGEKTIFARGRGRSTVVDKLHYQFDGWLGDELLESTPCFIVSSAPAREIEQAHLTGASFDEAEVTISDQFRETYPDRKLPEFVWLKVGTAAAQNDFGITQDLRLIVSERALEVLRQFNLANAVVSPTEFEETRPPVVGKRVRTKHAPKD